jgi:hypothetical protein
VNRPTLDVVCDALFIDELVFVRLACTGQTPRKFAVRFVVLGAD